MCRALPDLAGMEVSASRNRVLPQCFKSPFTSGLISFLNIFIYCRKALFYVMLEEMTAGKMGICCVLRTKKKNKLEAYVCNRLESYHPSRNFWRFWKNEWWNFEIIPRGAGLIHVSEKTLRTTGTKLRSAVAEVALCTVPSATQAPWTR